MNWLLGFLAVGLGKVISLGSLLICAIVIGRSAGPEEFGLYSAALSLALLLDSSLGSPLDYTAVRFAALHSDDLERTARFQGAAFRIKLAVGLLLLILAITIGRRLSAIVLHDPSRTSLVYLAGGVTVLLLLVRSTAASLQAQNRFRSYSVLDAIQGALRVGLIGALAFAGITRAEWYLGAFGVALVFVYGIFLLLVRQPYLTARWPESNDALSLWQFLGLTTGVVLLGTITGRTDVLFLVTQTDLGTVGKYAGAMQIASILTLLAGYASIVVQPTLVVSLRNGQLPKLLLGSIALASAAGILAVAISWSFGASLMEALFGESFSDAGRVLCILVVGTSLDLVMMPIAMTYILQFHARSALAGEGVITALYLIAAAPVAAHGIVTLAWLVTGIRAVKVILYVGLTSYEIRRDRAALAAPS